jgi:PAS domain S-box-containing protein
MERRARRNAERRLAGDEGQQDEKRISRLKKSESRIQRLLGSVTSYVYSVSLSDGHAISTRHREGCEEVTGYSPADFSAEPYLWNLIVHPEDWPKVEEMLREMVAEPRELSLVHRIRHRDGSLRWVRNLLEPSFDDKGRLVGYDGIINDITARKEAEESLLSSERSRRLILESCRDMVISLDRSARLAYFNAAFEAMVRELRGGRKPELGEKIASEGLPRPLRSRLQGLFDRAIRGESLDESFEVELRGETRALELSFAPIACDKDRIEGVSVFIRDATEKAAERRAYAELVRGIAAESGLECLDGMARRLEEWLRAEGVVIGEFRDGCSSILIRAARLGGRKLAQAPYSIAAGSCSRISGERICFCPKHGPWVFPAEAGPPTLCMDSHLGVPIRGSDGATLGIICAVSRLPIKVSPVAMEAMELMALKAGSEMERGRRGGGGGRL